MSNITSAMCIAEDVYTGVLVDEASERSRGYVVCALKRSTYSKRSSLFNHRLTTDAFNLQADGDDTPIIVIGKPKVIHRGAISSFAHCECESIYNDVKLTTTWTATCKFRKRQTTARRVKKLSPTNIQANVSVESMPNLFDHLGPISCALNKQLESGTCLLSPELLDFDFGMKSSIFSPSENLLFSAQESYRNHTFNFVHSLGFLRSTTHRNQSLTPPKARRCPALQRHRRRRALCRPHCYCIYSTSDDDASAVIVSECKPVYINCRYSSGAYRYAA